jgi:hypothetical protein
MTLQEDIRKYNSNAYKTGEWSLKSLMWDKEKTIKHYKLKCFFTKNEHEVETKDTCVVIASGDYTCTITNTRTELKDITLKGLNAVQVLKKYVDTIYTDETRAYTKDKLLSVNDFYGELNDIEAELVIKLLIEGYRVVGSCFKELGENGKRKKWVYIEPALGFAKWLVEETDLLDS